GVKPTINHIFGNVDAQRLVHRLGFMHHLLAQLAQSRFGGDPVQGGVGQRADRVEADVAPKLQPDIPANLIADRRFEIGARQNVAQRLDTLRTGAVGLADGEALELMMLDHPGGDDLTSRVNDASDRALRPDFGPLPGARIDRFEMPAVEAAAFLVEIPPWNTVHRRDQGGVAPEQRTELFSRFMRLVGLQRANDVILRPEIGRIGTGGDPSDLFLAFDDQLEAVLADGVEMGAPDDRRNLMAGQRQFRREIAADRSSAENTDFHGAFPSENRTGVVSPSGFPRSDAMGPTRGSGGATHFLAAEKCGWPQSPTSCGRTPVNPERSGKL